MTQPNLTKNEVRAINKQAIPHQGRHSNAYHEYMLKEVNRIDGVARGNAATFLKEFDMVKQKVSNLPEMLTKAFWR